MNTWILVAAAIILTVVIWTYYKFKMIKSLQNFETYVMMLLINSEIYEDHRQKFDDFLKNEIARIPHEGSNRFVTASRAIDRMAMGGEGHWHIIVQKHMADL